ncbi:MAG: ABC transporter-like protein [Candidatus Aramenus sulfurataquae]|uniref:ABC transporter-like protein n=1 Tax=Candidatus Aramenus sulfurataquae TaxID=1326980 RepID=W7KVP2_9CREN|nr:MAG: ABC transporter-like protein [Candidatus Aramenus sulfurataquae]
MSVELRNVTRRFKEVVALDNVNLKVEKGEFFVILGPSGCGKTTLLRVVAGLERAEGEVIIDGINVTRFPPHKRGVAMVFQNYALYPNKTVYENLAMPLEDLEKKEAEERIQYVSKSLGIGDLLNRYPGELSGGQQQRIALARALVRKPKVFLMDEPLSNLDAPLRLQARRLVKEIQMENGITTIYVTHDQAEAMALADRVAIMKKGKIVQIGTPEEIYENPADAFVASFFGLPPMSLVNGKPFDVNGEVGIRIEDVFLGQEGFVGEVSDVEFWGDKYLVYVKFEGGEVRAFSKEKLKVGTQVKFSVRKYKVFGGDGRS